MLRRTARWIADRELWPLAVGAALATFFPGYAAYGLLLILLLWLIRWAARGRPTIPCPYNLPALILLLMAGVSLVISVDPMTSFVWAARLIAGIALMLGIVNWARSEAHLAVLGIVMAVVGLGMALLTPLGIEWPRTLEAAAERLPASSTWLTALRGSFNPNMMAGALAVLIPFPLALLLFSPVRYPSTRGAVLHPIAWLLDRAWVRLPLCLLTLAAVPAALFVTQSRGGWLGAGAALWVLLAGHWPGWGILLPAAVGAGGYALWHSDLLTTPQRYLVTSSLSSLAGRGDIWLRALYVLRDFPLTGVGLGMFGKAVGWLYPKFNGFDVVHYPHAHNLFLQVGADLGVPGLLAYLWMLGAAFWAGAAAARGLGRQGKRGLQGLAWACLAGLAGMTLHGILDATTWVVGKGGFVPFMVMGLAAALSMTSHSIPQENVDNFLDNNVQV